MSRYRLRFLLQEFDLIGPQVIIGRSPDCQITIEDPLISREHARIQIQEVGPTVEDLGSRNGVKINGRRIDGQTVLTDGDRIRLGTLELVFSVVVHRSREARQTGYLVSCKQCDTPYPDHAGACPHCGAEAPTTNSPDETLTDSAARADSWTFGLFLEVAERALVRERFEEADRILGRAKKELERRTLLKLEVNPEQADAVCAKALRLARLGKTEGWLEWVLQLLAESPREPSEGLLSELEQAAFAANSAAEATLHAYVNSLTGPGSGYKPGGDSEALNRLSALVGR